MSEVDTTPEVHRLARGVEHGAQGVGDQRDPAPGAVPRPVIVDLQPEGVEQREGLQVGQPRQVEICDRQRVEQGRRRDRVAAGFDTVNRTCDVSTKRRFIAPLRASGATGIPTPLDARRLDDSACRRDVHVEEVVDVVDLLVPADGAGP